MKNFILTIVLLPLLFGVHVQAEDVVAKKNCRSIFGMDADDSTTSSASGCQLICVIHGRPQSHVLPDGVDCPYYSDGVSNRKLFFIKIFAFNHFFRHVKTDNAL